MCCGYSFEGREQVHPAQIACDSNSPSGQQKCERVRAIVSQQNGLTGIREEDKGGKKQEWQRTSGPRVTRVNPQRFSLRVNDVNFVALKKLGNTLAVMSKKEKESVAMSVLHHYQDNQNKNDY